MCTMLYLWWCYNGLGGSGSVGGLGRGSLVNGDFRGAGLGDRGSNESGGGRNDSGGGSNENGGGSNDSGGGGNDSGGTISE